MDPQNNLDHFWHTLLELELWLMVMVKFRVRVYG